MRILHRITRGGSHHAFSLPDELRYARKGPPAFAVTLLLMAQHVFATVGPPVKIRMPPDSPPAVSGREYTGVFEVRLHRGGVIDDIQLRGEGWQVLAVEQPAGPAFKPAGLVRIAFRAIPADADQPLTLTLRYNGRIVSRTYRLGPKAFARRGRDRAAVQVAPGLGRPPHQQEEPQATPAPRGGAISLRFTGRIVYTRPSGVDANGNAIWAGATDEGVDAVWIQVMDEDDISDEVIWSGLTFADGTFDTGQIFWDDCDVTGCDDPDIYIRWECDTGVVNVQDAEDITEPDYSWSNEDNVIDDFTGSFHDFGTWKPADLNQMAALHIHNSIVRAHRYIFLKSGTGISVKELDLLWPDSGNNAFYDPSDEEIHISPRRQWNEGTHTHEYGHHFLENYAVNVAPEYCNADQGDTAFCDDDSGVPNCYMTPTGDCGHCVWCRETNHDAWNEGFPNWLADVVTRDYTFSYFFSDQTPYVALMPRSQESTSPCCQDGMVHDPLRTEGFIGALLRDMEDDLDPAGASLQDDHDTDGIIDCLKLGPQEIFVVTVTLTPTTPAQFIQDFQSLYPQFRPAFWSTAFNVHPNYTTGGLFPPDTQPPGLVQNVRSPTHPFGVGGPLPCITLMWDIPTDDVTGGCAYSIAWSTSPAGVEPDMLEEVSGSCVTFTDGPFDLGEHYISIRARDCADNWSAQWATFGPFIVTDCNANGTVDVCEITCNASGLSDGLGCSIDAPFCSSDPNCGTGQDCNQNLVPDDCDIAGGFSEDCNENGVPDECEIMTHWAGGNGLWETATKWVEQQVPTAGHVCIASGDGALVTLADTIAVVSTLACEENLAITGGSFPNPDLTLTEPSWIRGDLTHSGPGAWLRINQRLDIDGLFTWTGNNANLGGAGTTYAHGGVQITSVVPLQNHTLVIDASSTAVLTGRIFFEGTSQLQIRPGSTFYHQNPSGGLEGGPGDLFVNQGTFIKRVETGTGQISVETQNAGLIHVQTGTLQLSRGSTTTGQFMGDAGTTIEFVGGGHTLEPGSSLTAHNVRFTNGIAGENVIHGTWNVSGSTIKTAGQNLTFASDADIVDYGENFSILGQVNFNAGVGATVHFTSFTIGSGFQAGTATFNSGDPVTIDTLSLGPGSMTGPGAITINHLLMWNASGHFIGPGIVHANGDVVIGPGGGQKTLNNRTFNNAATATFHGGFEMNSAAVFNNLATGVLDIQADSGGNIIGGSGTSNTLFNNAGTLVKTAGAGTSRIASPTVNTGRIEIQVGQLEFYTFFNGSYIQTAGETFLNGGNLSINGPAPLQIDGGLLRGAGIITANVVNSGGSVAPGASAGWLDITGNYTQGAGGRLHIELGGLIAGTEHDRLAVSGTAQLDGELHIAPVSGFPPQPGQQFTILTAGVRQGEFASLTGPVLFTATYTPTEVVVTITASCSFPADFDADCDVDGDDLDLLSACRTAPAVHYNPQNLPPGCGLTPDGNGRLPADLDADQDVDLDDFSVWQRCYSGSSTSPDPGCAN